MNQYRYVWNNPIIYIDPWGLCKEESWWEKTKLWAEEAWDYYLYESELPGPYGQPMSEWGPEGPTRWGDPIGLSERQGGWSEGLTKGAYYTSVVATVVAGGLMAGEVIYGVNTKIAFHGAHHTFRLGPWSAKLHHIQTIIWRTGVKGSEIISRIPLPW